MLRENKFNELCNINDFITKYYYKLDNGFYKCKELNSEDRKQLIDYFESVKFSALNFTDSRNAYQFFNLTQLWEIIEKCFNYSINKINIVSEPISIKELYRYLKGEEFNNEIGNQVLRYDLKTKYDTLFGGNDGYIYSKQFLLNDIKEYIKKEKNKLIRK